MNTNALIIYKKNCKGILNGNTYLQILAQESDIWSINPVTFPGSKCYLYMNASKRKEREIF